MHLLFILFWLMGSPKDTLHLKADLKKDYKILYAEHGAHIDELAKQDLKLFERYAGINLSAYKFTKQTKGNHVISKWTNLKARMVIYQIETTIAVDTIYEEEYIKIDSIGSHFEKSGNKYPIKGTFHFRTYVIKPYGMQGLIYHTDDDGLIEYKIGNRNVAPAYEAISIGKPYLDLKPILMLAK